MTEQPDRRDDDRTDARVPVGEADVQADIERASDDGGNEPD